ncbi:SprT-like domain-containing protein [Glaciecola sp. 1036]|uniref:SprT-like domain-containing protein n=1 Tax=Alteromonadaceae TaxID=72275 RepID=UPI003CFEB262
MQNKELFLQASHWLNYWYEKLANTDFANMPIPKLTLDQRGAIAGSARLQKHHIKLNPKLYTHNQHYFEQQVIPHELAHLVAFYHYGRVKPHGHEWQNIMQSCFKRPADVTHKLDLKKAGIKRFTYACECREVEFTAVRHNKVKRHQQSYICRDCRSPLVNVD